MPIKNRFTERILLIAAGVLIAVPSFSQPGPPTGPSGPPCWPPPCSVPINGGIIILLASGLFLGLYMLYKMRKKTIL